MMSSFGPSKSGDAPLHQISAEGSPGTPLNPYPKLAVPQTPERSLLPRNQALPTKQLVERA